MKAAVIVPNWQGIISGGRRGLHLISKTLREMGVECVSVGIPYPYDTIGDVVVDPVHFRPDEHTALIIPEGYTGAAMTYYLPFIEDQPHGPVVVYVQNFGMVDKRRPWETHYWSLGKEHRKLVRDRMEIPEEIPIRELMLPIDCDFWTPQHLPRIPGSILYSPRRNPVTLDAVIRHTCQKNAAFRIMGATPKQVRRLMSQADIFLLASNAEGQSIFLNEAMAMECACVSWVSGGIADIIESKKTGLLVEDRDFIGLCDAVESLQASPEKARRMGKKARLWVQESLSYKQFRKQLEEAWSDVANP